MKSLYSKFILISIGITTSLTQLHAQSEWKWQKPNNLHHYISDLAYFGPNKFYLSGSMGDVWKTTDGGQNYNSVKIKGVKSGSSLYFPNENQGWAATGDGEVYYTSDAGNNWTKQLQDPNGSTFSSIHFDEEVGYVSGDGGYVDNVLYKTTDGGNSWQPVTNLPIREAAAFSGLFFVQTFGPDTVFAVSWNNLIYRSYNGGQSWDTTDINPANTASYHEGAYFCDSQHGWVVGPNQSIVHTKDGGKTWVAQLGHKDSVHYFSEVFFLDSLNGWASSFDPTGCLFKTNDGGATWVKRVVNMGVVEKMPYFSWTSITVSPPMEPAYFLPQMEVLRSARQIKTMLRHFTQLHF